MNKRSHDWGLEWLLGTSKSDGVFSFLPTMDDIGWRHMAAIDTGMAGRHKDGVSIFLGESLVLHYYYHWTDPELL
jgi:hypothetical protein